MIQELKDLECIVPRIKNGREEGYIISGTPITLTVSHNDIKPTFLFLTTKLISKPDHYLNPFWLEDSTSKDPNELGLYVSIQKLFDLVDLPGEILEFIALRMSMFVDGDISDIWD